MKQLNFRHFNTNRKIFTVTVSFSQKETKTAPKRPTLFCLVYQEVFSHFSTIPDHFGRLPKTAEDFRGEIRRFPTIFCRHTLVKDMFDTIFSVREILVIHSNLYNNRILFIIKIGNSAHQK